MMLLVTSAWTGKQSGSIVSIINDCIKNDRTEWPALFRSRIVKDGEA